MHRVVADYTSFDASNTNIKVFVRARPLEDKSLVSDFIEVDKENDRKITIRDPDVANRRYGEVSFQFDQIFWTEAKQSDVFDAMCKPQIEHVINGYNSCCFAYGQTGSGKTYSMFGEDSEIRGVIPRAVETLFKTLAKRSSTCEVAMICSFLEIYNDQIRDLGKAYLVAMGVEASDSSALFEKTSDIFESLAGKRGNPYFAPAFSKNRQSNASENRPGLKEVIDEYNTMNYEIREDNEGHVFVKDLSLVPVSTLEEVMSLINMGLKVRATHETKMNPSSSRSHTVFTITVLQRDKISGEAIQGMLNLVDLAGSERLKKSESQGTRLKEALHINTSLTALGKVIMALEPSSEMTHIPYRDSKLTRVLQNSLGGNSFTTLLAAIHPHPNHYEECLSTLQFANRCRNVRNNPRVNYVGDNEDKDRKIKRLMDEVSSLRNRLQSFEMNGGVGASLGLPGGLASLSKIVYQILKRFGFTPVLNGDGSVTCNGITLTQNDIQGFFIPSEGLEDSSSMLLTSESGGGGLTRGGTNGTAGTLGASTRYSTNTMMSQDKMKALISELQETNSNLQTKAKERKALMEEQGKQIQELSNEVAKYQTSMKHKEFEYQELVLEKQRELEELQHHLESHFQLEKEELVRNSHHIVTAQQDLLHRVPETFRQYSNLVKKADGVRLNLEGPLRKEFGIHLEEINQSRLKEIQHIQSQYEHWIQEKDTVLADFVKKFNDFRKKRSEQLRLCENEIVRLYQYVEQLESLLDRVESGEFEVRQAQGAYPQSTTGVLFFDGPGNSYPTDSYGNPNINPNINPIVVSGSAKPTGAVNQAWESMKEPWIQSTRIGGTIFPKGARPTNPLHRPSSRDLELTRKIVAKYQERENKLQKVKEEAFQKSLHYATRITSVAAIGPVDPVLQRQIADLLVPPKSDKRTTSRPKTAGLMGVSSSPEEFKTIQFEDLVNSNTSINSNNPPGTTSVRDILTPSPSRRNSTMSNSTKNLLLELETLRAENNVLRAEKRQEEVSLQKLSQEVASDATVNYIRHLEEEVQKLHKQIHDTNASLQYTKSANAALSRSLSKTMKPSSTSKTST